MAAPKKDPKDKVSCNHSYKLTPGESQQLVQICDQLGISKSNLMRWFLPFCNGGCLGGGIRQRGEPSESENVFRGTGAA